MNNALPQRIALMTDFGDGLYLGQMHARLAALLPMMPLIDFVHDLPVFRPDLAAYLLPALVRDMPDGTLYLCLVDPGVGGERAALIVQADRNWFIAPDNGLLALIVQRATTCTIWRIGWRSAVMSASFHGRDLFVPAVARFYLGQDLGLTALAAESLVGANWPNALASILYIDHFGNLITGLQASERDRAPLQVGTHCLPYARTFCEVASGTAFWYENAFGLIEFAVNQGRADRFLGLAAGDAIPFTASASRIDQKTR